jgi:putative transposase
MTERIRKRYSGQFKFEVALSAAKEQKTLNELASQHGLHPNQISEWKQKLLKEGASLFSQRQEVKELEGSKREGELYAEIGRLKMELDWLKKKVAHSS